MWSALVWVLCMCYFVFITYCMLCPPILLSSAVLKSSANDWPSSDLKSSSTVLLRSPLTSAAFEPQLISAGGELRGVRAGCWWYHTLCTLTADDFVTSCLAFVTSTQPKVGPHRGGSLRFRYKSHGSCCCRHCRGADWTIVVITLPSFEWQDLAADKSETCRLPKQPVSDLLHPATLVPDCCTSILYGDIIARLIKMEAGKAVGYTRLIALSVRLLIHRKDVTILL